MRIIAILLAIACSVTFSGELEDQICTAYPGECTFCQPVPPPEPEPSDYAWEEIPDSSMDTVFDPALDIEPFELVFQTWPWNYPVSAKIWEHIQDGWSGGVVVGDQFCVSGGGHGGSPHNGVFCMDAAGQWDRTVEPSPIWSTDNPDCAPDVEDLYVCTMPNGQTCPMNECAIMPDGHPTSVHTYNSLATDGAEIFRVGGSPWQASQWAGPRAWRLDLAQKQWTEFADNTKAGRGSFVYGGNGKFYMSTHSGVGIYELATDSWLPVSTVGEGYKKFGDQVTMVKCGDYFCALGQGNAYRTSIENFPLGWEELPYTPAQDALGPGVVWFNELLWVWTGGNSFEVYNPLEDVWEVVTPSGDGPGPALDKGTYGRIGVLDGSIYLINGVHSNAFKVIATPQEPEIPDPPPEGGDVPFTVNDPRGEEWGHTIVVDTLIGPSEPAVYQSCDDVLLPCETADPSIMDDFTRAVDALPDRGGVVLVEPGVHVITRDTAPRKKWRVLHIQGIPDADGRRPIIRSTLTYAKKVSDNRYERPRVDPQIGISFPKTAKNLILENIELQNFSGSCVKVDNSVYNGEDQAVLVKNSFVHHCYFVGFSMGSGPAMNRQGSLYIVDSEMSYIWSGAHMLYFAGGENFYTRDSYYHSAGWHALKVIAHNIAIIDSLLSQAGPDGTPMPQVGAINEGVKIGQGSAASLVACQRGVIRDNHFIGLYGMTAARQRRYDIDGCDFEASYYPRPGIPLTTPGEIAKYPAEPTQFWSPEFWLSVADGGDIEDGNPHLLPIFWYQNIFDYRSDGQNRFAVSNSSTYPVDKDKPLPVVPDDWEERSRDAFYENELLGYESYYNCGSADQATAEECSTLVPIFVHGDKPDWFITDPLEISTSLQEPSIEDLYAAYTNG